MADRAYENPEINKFVSWPSPHRAFWNARGSIRSRSLDVLGARFSFMTGQSLVLDGGLLAGPNPPKPAG